MALTGLQVITDRTEYSRFEPGKEIIRARVIPTPSTGLVGETVDVRLVRRDGGVVASTTVTFDGDAPKGTIVDMDTRATDADGIPAVVRGEYAVEASQGNLKTGAPIHVSVITVEAMKRSYCQGAPLYSSAIMAPKKQPSAVTGVTITGISERTKPGVYALAYNQTANTLSWAGGIPIELNAGSREEILLDTLGNYIEVSLDHFDLPGADASEGILVDRQAMSDDHIRHEINIAVDEAETALRVSVEPMRIATEPYFSNPQPGQYFDRKAPALSYYRNDFNQRGLAWHLDLPVQQLQKVSLVEGYMGNSRALEISSGALAVNKTSGALDVLPYNSQYSYLYTFFVGINFWGVRDFIADFWRYIAVAGIDTMPGDVLKMIGYNAAVTLLTTAGQAFRGGATSESISKDGVSRSASYQPQGVYGAAITEYKDWLKTNAPKIRNRYRGIPCVVL
jgi:hypothetical protein